MTSRPTPLVLTSVGLVLLVVLGRLVGGTGPSLTVVTKAASAPAPSSASAPPDDGEAPAPEPAVVALEPVAFTVDSLEARSPSGVLGAVPDDVHQAVLGVLQQYVTAATLDPLTPEGARSGVDLAGLFTDATRPRLDGPDRAALVDEGLPPATGGVSAERALASLTALADGDGTVRMVTAALDLQLRAHTVDGHLLIARTGELVLVPEADAWRINAYRVNVRRELGADASAQAGL